MKTYTFLLIPIILFFSSQSYAVECSRKSHASEIPSSGVGEICLNGYYTIVSTEKSFIVKGNVPTALAVSLSEKAAHLSAKGSLVRFLNSSNFESTSFFTEAIKATNAGASYDVNQTMGQKNTIKTRAIRGVFTLQAKRDNDFSYVTVAVSRKSLRMADRINSSANINNYTKKTPEKQNKIYGPGSSKSQYSTTISNEEWVSPFLK